MARPPAKDLTPRELEVMHVFWNYGEANAAEVREHLIAAGRALTYPTVANLIRGLHEKGFLKQLNAERPFSYCAVRSYEEVSGRLLSDVLCRVFRGSREQLLLRLVDGRKLTVREREVLEEILKESKR
jgi:BlaI family transcriptional regulator, penicillinase repressor